MYLVSLDPICSRIFAFSISDWVGMMFFSSRSCLVGRLLRKRAKLSCRATLAAREPVADTQVLSLHSHNHWILNQPALTFQHNQFYFTDTITESTTLNPQKGTKAGIFTITESTWLNLQECTKAGAITITESTTLNPQESTITIKSSILKPQSQSLNQLYLTPKHKHNQINYI